MAARRVLWVMKGLGLGGAERLVTSSVRHFDPERYELEVAYVLPWKDAFVGELEAAGIPVHCVGEAGPRVRWIPALLRLATRGGFDLVHTHSPVTSLPLRVTPERFRPVLVHTEHNMWGRYRWLTYAANAATYGANASVLAVSNGVLSSIERPRWAPWVRIPPAVALYHGIDPTTAVRGPEARAAARETLGLPQDAPVLGTVANFTPKKDQRTLFALVKQLSDGYPDLRLVLIGSGPLEAELRAAAAAEGLADRVLFTGPRNDVPNLLPAFDVFVLSSLHEGLSIALLEAMASGVPPVATAVGGVPEVINDGVDGFLVPTRDPVAMAKPVEALLSDEVLYRSMSAEAERRSHDFGIARAVAAMEDFYDEVLA